MKKILLSILLSLFLNLAIPAQDEIKISLKNSSKAEQQTKEQLQRLLKTYDLSKWIFTKSIIIDEKEAIPHSHPALRLSTRHLKDDELLISTFIHEQAHWFVSEDQNRQAAAVKDFKEMFPKVPVGFPEGARDESSTYIHISVIYLEYRAIRELLGELKAKQIMDFWATDHYTWIYKTVRDRPRDIGNIMFKHKMIPTVRTGQTEQKETKSDE
jgi:hypothetical protein